jgi:hypothetical protein
MSITQPGHLTFVRLLSDVGAEVNEKLMQLFRENLAIMVSYNEKRDEL